jgi:opacity protein-like surface antigen
MRADWMLAAAVVLPGCAMAQGGAPVPGTGTDYARTGPYAGFGILEGFEEFDPPGGLNATDSDLGIAVRGGMRLNPNVAVEATIEDASEFRLRTPAGSTDLDIWSLGVQGKYFLATDKVQPYLLAGVGAARVEVDRFASDEEGGYFRLGFGSDFYVNRDVALFGEATYNHLLGDVRDFDHVDVLIGVLVRF